MSTTVASDHLPPIADPAESADAAGLRYYTDERPGIRRKRAGRNFSYVGLDGAPVRDPEELKRFKALAIPPAWTDVWICPSPRGHIQATGRDARGRKQYKYHQRWRQVRDETKYARLITFAEALPVVRERTDRDLSEHSLSRDKVLATVVKLLDVTALRVGNEEYARDNKSFGLTTVRTRHVDVSGSAVQFHFRGKSGKNHVVGVREARLARAVKRCRDLPGYELFRFLDEEGELRSIDSGDVNDYLRQITGENFTAKDFRTWHGTVCAATELARSGPFHSEVEARRHVNDAIAAASQRLGNTPAICRKSYVHPAIIQSYLDGTFLSTWEHAVNESESDSTSRLSPEEIAVVAVLQRSLETVVDHQRVAS